MRNEFQNVQAIPGRVNAKVQSEYKVMLTLSYKACQNNLTIRLFLPIKIANILLLPVVGDE